MLFLNLKLKHPCLFWTHSNNPKGLNGDPTGRAKQYKCLVQKAILPSHGWAVLVIQHQLGEENG